MFYFINEFFEAIKPLKFMGLTFLRKVELLIDLLANRLVIRERVEVVAICF